MAIEGLTPRELEALERVAVHVASDIKTTPIFTAIPRQGGYHSWDSSQDSWASYNVVVGYVGAAWCE